MWVFCVPRLARAYGFVMLGLHFGYTRRQLTSGMRGRDYRPGRPYLVFWEDIAWAVPPAFALQLFSLLLWRVIFFTLPPTPYVYSFR